MCSIFLLKYDIIKLDRWFLCLLQFKPVQYANFTFYFSQQTHKEAKGLWELKLPFLHALDDVYGRDKATGAVSETFYEAAVKVVRELREKQIN